MEAQCTCTYSACTCIYMYTYMYTQTVKVALEYIQTSITLFLGIIIFFVNRKVGTEVPKITLKTPVLSAGDIHVPAHAHDVQPTMHQCNQ